MSDGNGLPNGWAHCALEELVTESLNGFGKRSQAEGTPVIVLRLADITEGQVQLLKPRQINATNEQIEKYVLKEHDLIAIRVNGSTDLVGRLIELRGFDQPVLYCDHFIRLRFTYPELARYVRLYADTQPFRNYIDKNKVSSAGQNTVSQTTLAKAQIPLPPSSEQTRIADRIDELFTDLAAGVTALERVRKKLKRYRSAVLHAAVTGRLTEGWRKEHGPPAESGEELLKRLLVQRRRQWEERTLAEYEAKGKQPPKNWRQRYQEPVKPNTDELPELPKGWCWASLDQLFLISSGTTPRRGVAAYWKGGHIPWIPSAVVNNPFVDSASEFVTAEALDETTLRIYEPGTLLIALYGEGKTRGKVTELRIAATINQALAALCWISGFTWIKDFVKCVVMAKYDDLRRKSAGGVQPNLNVDLVTKIVVPFPSAEEQEVIYDLVYERLSQIEAMQTEVTRGLARAARLRQAILKSAFAGELVAQDPQDEPASLLLERIRIEREALAAQSNGRPKRASRKKVALTKKAAKSAKSKPTKKKARKS